MLATLYADMTNETFQDISFDFKHESLLYEDEKNADFTSCTLNWNVQISELANVLYSECGFFGIYFR